MKATFGSSASIALRNLFMFVGAVAMMVGDQPEAVGLCAGRDSRSSCCRSIAAGRSVRERSRRAQDTLAEATAFATESLGAVRVMQAFVAEEFTARRFRAAADGAYEAARAMTQARAIVTVAALFLAFSSVVVVLWLGAHDVIEGRMTGGVLLQFLLFAVLGAERARPDSREVWNEVSQAAGAAARIGELLALAAQHRRARQPARRCPTPARGELRSSTSASPIRRGRTTQCCAASIFTVSPGEIGRRSSAPRAPASRRCSS